MKTMTYLSVLFAGLGVASAIATPEMQNAEGIAARDTAAKYEGTCKKSSQVCNYKVNGDSRQCNCGAPDGGLCTKDGNTCHWNTDANPNKCNCT